MKINLQSIIEAIPKLRRDDGFNRRRFVMRMIHIVDHIEDISISDCKEIVSNLLNECDLRDSEDHTDFSFLKRRKTDK